MKGCAALKTGCFVGPLDCYPPTKTDKNNVSNVTPPMSYCFDFAIDAISTFNKHHPLNGFEFCETIISPVDHLEFQTKRQFATEMTNIFIYLTIIIFVLCNFLLTNWSKCQSAFSSLWCGWKLHLINDQLHAIGFTAKLNILTANVLLVLAIAPFVTDPFHSWVLPIFGIFKGITSI